MCFLVLNKSSCLPTTCNKLFIILKLEKALHSMAQNNVIWHDHEKWHLEGAMKVSQAHMTSLEQSYFSCISLIGGMIIHFTINQIASNLHVLQTLQLPNMYISGSALPWWSDTMVRHKSDGGLLEETSVEEDVSADIRSCAAVEGVGHPQRTTTEAVTETSRYMAGLKSLSYIMQEIYYWGNYFPYTWTFMSSYPNV